ncbi:MAG: hypothetical protein ACUZ8A_03135 [Candidatus Bathyanammoxibius sp.]
MAGGTSSFGAGGLDLWVLKLSPGGTVEWQKSYGGAGYDCANSIQQTGDGGYIVAGLTEAFDVGDHDFWVLKLRPDGTVEWQKTYGGIFADWAFSIRQTVDEGYIVTGRTQSFGAGNFDVWVLRLKPDGAVEWQKTFGGADSEEAYVVLQTKDGGYVVAGGTSSFSTGGLELWVLKLSPGGTVEWQKSYGGAGYGCANSIQQTGDGGYIVAGEAASFGAGGLDAWLLKLRPDGTVEWQKTYGGNYNDRGYFVRQTADGGYVVAGWTQSFGVGSDDFWVLKLRPDGAVEWQKTFGGVKNDWVYSIQQTSDGGYVVAGETVSFNAKAQDVLVLKLRPDGSISPSCHFMFDTGIFGMDSKAKVKTTNASHKDTNVTPHAPLITVRDTDVSANILCTSKTAD